MSWTTRTIWYGFGLLAATAFVLAGCVSSDPHKAPKHPDEFTVPPSEDARYSQPPQYPKDVLNQDRVPATTDGTPQGKKAPSRPGGGPSAPGGPGGY